MAVRWTVAYRETQQLDNVGATEAVFRLDVMVDNLFSGLSCFDVENVAGNWQSKAAVTAGGLTAADRQTGSRVWTLQATDGVFSVVTLDAPQAYLTRFLNQHGAKSLGAAFPMATTQAGLATLADQWIQQVLQLGPQYGYNPDPAAVTNLDKLLSMLEGVVLPADFDIVRDSYLAALRATEPRPYHWIRQFMFAPTNDPRTGKLEIARLYAMHQAIKAAQPQDSVRAFNYIYQAASLARARPLLP